MRIVIVNPFDQLPWENHRRGRYGLLASELTNRGHQVIWLTADFSHATKRFREWPAIWGCPALEVKPIHVASYVKNISLRRLISHRVYASGVRKALNQLHESNPINAVIASVPPIESARSAMQFCAATGVRGVIDMQDAWPRVLELAFPRWARKLANAILLAPFRRDLAAAVELAAGWVAVSGAYLDYLVSFRKKGAGRPRRVVPLGFDPRVVESQPARPLKQPGSPLVIAYIGTFGRFYDLATVVRAARECAAANISFLLIGNGPTYESTVGLARTLDLHNVQFKGRLTFESAVPMLLQSDVGLVPITSDWPPSLPNKVFDYLFLGLPIVSSIKGDLERIVREGRIGLQYEAGDPQSLSDALLALNADRAMLHEMSQRGYEYARQHADGDRIYSQYADFLEELVDG